jgi:tRNA pseudouridine13 synthase
MFDMNTLSYAYGKPQVLARFKACEDDFKVDEILGFALSGLGEHQFLRIEKRGLNTEELVKRVARALDKSIKQISYAGLKDRNAVTTQWLSVHCPGETIANVNELIGDGWRVIESGRHLKKLKVGGLIGKDRARNNFPFLLKSVKSAY